MNVLIPQLIASNVLTGNAEGSNSLFGGQSGNGQVGSSGQGFLDIIATLTATPIIAPIQNTTEGVVIVDTGLLPTSTALLNAQQLDQGQVQEPQFATGQFIPLPGITSDVTTLPQDVSAQNDTNVPIGLSNILLPQVVGVEGSQILLGSENNSVSSEEVLLQLIGTKDHPDLGNVNIASAEAAVIDVTVNTLGSVVPNNVAEDNVNPLIVTQEFTPSNIALLNVLSNVQETKSRPEVAPAVLAAFPDNSSEGEFVLPPSFVVANAGEQKIATLPSALKISDLASQKTFNENNEGTKNALLNNPSLLINVAKNDNPLPQQNNLNITQVPIDTAEGTVEVSADPLLQANALLGSRLYKKAEDSLQQKASTPVTSTPVIVTQNTNNQPSQPVLMHDALKVKFTQVTSGAATTLTGDGSGGITSGNTMLPDQTASGFTQANGAQGVLAGMSSSEALSVAKQSLQPMTPVEQITVKVAHAIKDDIKKITIHLEPASLGKVDIRMDIAHDGKTHVSILVDRPETLDLLQKDAKQLQTALNDAGIKADAGSLNFSMRGGNEQQGRFGNQQGFSHYSNSQPLSPNEDVLLSEVQAYIGGFQSTQGIDIRV